LPDVFKLFRIENYEFRFSLERLAPNTISVQFNWVPFSAVLFGSLLLLCCQICNNINYRDSKGR